MARKLPLQNIQNANSGYIRNRNYCDIGTRIRQIRQLRGMTTSMLGKMIGMDSPHVNRYERNERTPTIYVLMDIADVLEVSLDQLVGRSSVDGLDHKPELPDIVKELGLIKLKDLATDLEVSDVTVRNHAKKLCLAVIDINGAYYCNQEQAQQIEDSVFINSKR